MNAAGVVLLALAGNVRVADFTVSQGAGTVMVSPATARATVVVFISAICPVSDKYLERLNSVYADYSRRDVQFVFADPNANETWADLQKYVQANAVDFPVFVDKDNRLADSLGAQSTPEAFVIDRVGNVRYSGAIDDAVNPVRVRSHTLRDALDAVLAGKPVSSTRSRALGCAIHRRSAK